MPRYVALLRAVNVGGRYVKMAPLREALVAAGFTDVDSYIQSGNLAVTSSRRSSALVERDLEAAIENFAGFAVPTMVRTPRALRDLAAELDRTPPLLHNSKRYVAFAKTPPRPGAREAIHAWEATPERALVLETDIVIDLAVGFHDAKLAGAKLERLAATALTARDMGVVRAVIDRWC